MDIYFAFLFWFCMLVLFYTYAGYPLLLSFMALTSRHEVRKGSEQPAVTLIISVYNEEKVIREKIENSLTQDYPKEKLEIIVASDDSTDDTHTIVKEFENRGVKLIIQKGRLGKTATLNRTIPVTKGEILVFTDANSMYDCKAIAMLVENFTDPEVGCVTGETRLINPEGGAVGENEKAYYSYDTFLKIKESAIGSTVGGDGAIFAIRRLLYEPLDPALINDFVIPLQIVAKGYRAVYEPRAFLHEATATPLKGGFNRRVRIINRALFGVMAVPQAMNPWRVGFFAVQLVSRKILRWTAPIFILLIFLANSFLLHKPLYLYFFCGQLFFFTIALIHIVTGDRFNNRFLNFPYYFCHANAAALIALVKFIQGERIVVWQPLRR